MSKVLVTEEYLEDIADAIRGKLSSSDTYTPGQMAGAIESIPSGGITPTGTINITENGTVDVTQYATANVNVSGGGESIVEITQYAQVSADSVFPGTISGYPQFTAEQALGDDFENWWGANGNGQHWWMIQLTSPKKLAVLKFSSDWVVGSSHWQSQSVVLQGSNDGSTWTDIESIGFVVSSTQLTHTIINDNSYLYYRLLCTSSNSYYTGIGKIRLYEKIGGVSA